MHAWQRRKDHNGVPQNKKKVVKEERKCYIFSSKLQRWNSCPARAEWLRTGMAWWECKQCQTPPLLPPFSLFSALFMALLPPQNVKTPAWDPPQSIPALPLLQSVLASQQWWEPIWSHTVWWTTFICCKEEKRKLAVAQLLQSWIMYKFHKTILLTVYAAPAWAVEFHINGVEKTPRFR